MGCGVAEHLRLQQRNGQEDFNYGHLKSRIHVENTSVIGIDKVSLCMNYHKQRCLSSDGCVNAFPILLGTAFTLEQDSDNVKGGNIPLISILQQQ